jgi:putative transposase
VEDQHEEDTQDLQRVRPSIAQQASEAPGKGKAQRRTPGGGRAERRLGYALPWQAFAGKRREGDFVHDQLATGKKLRILTAVDTHSRCCPAADARFTYLGEDVVHTLEGICRKIGYPKTIRVDNGTEFISRDLDLWAYANNVTLDFSRPGKPTGLPYEK